MKRAFFILIMMVLAIGGHAQFTQDNSILRKVISGYELNSDGYKKKIHVACEQFIHWSPLKWTKNFLAYSF